MRAAGVDDFSFDDSSAIFLSAFFSGAPVSFVMELKLAGQAVNVPIIRH